MGFRKEKEPPFAVCAVQVAACGSKVQEAPIATLAV